MGAALGLPLASGAELELLPELPLPELPPPEPKRLPVPWLLAAPPP